MNRSWEKIVFVLCIVVWGISPVNPAGLLPAAAESQELPVSRVYLGPAVESFLAPDGKTLISEAVEGYFSPDGQQIICYAKLKADHHSHVVVAARNGSNIHFPNCLGEDYSCTFFLPSGKEVIWTSNRDHPDLPGTDFHSSQLPAGMELYISDQNGNQLRRLTNNSWYDAEVSISPDGKYVLFTRQVNGQDDLWRMKIDGSGEEQITKTADWQEGGAFYLPDSETIIYRAWRITDEGQKVKPMEIFTIKQDGTSLRQITHDGGTNWSPFPCPDGRHFVFVKLLPPHNFEIFLGDLKSEEERRLTWNEAFDSFPSVSRDGKTVIISSSRDAPPGKKITGLYFIDVSSLGLGPPRPEK